MNFFSFQCSHEVLLPPQPRAKNSHLICNANNLTGFYISQKNAENMKQSEHLIQQCPVSVKGYSKKERKERKEQYD